MAITTRKLDNHDSQAIEKLLLDKLNTSVTFLSNFRRAGVDYSSKIYSGDYFGCFENSKLIGLIAHYWNGMIAIQAEQGLQELLSLLLKSTNRPVSGLIGPNNATQQIKKLLFSDESNIQLNDNSVTYCLELSNLVIPKKLSSGDVIARKLEEKDLELFCQWMLKYSNEALNAKTNQTLKQAWEKSARLALREDSTWVLECEKQLVSTCSINAKTIEAIGVGSVWTPLEYRSREYGRSVLAAALFDCWSNKIPKAILFTQADNKAAQNCYNSLGFKQVDEYRLVLCKQEVKFQI